jgi:hypothetical protein
LTELPFDLELLADFCDFRDFWLFSPVFFFAFSISA